MGYTGEKPCSERSKEEIIEEAYAVVKAGLDMLEIVKRESEKKEVLKELNMRIGIHTG